MSRITTAILIGALVALTATALAFTATTGTKQTDATARAAVDSVEMMKRAPRSLPVEQWDAY
jgi:Spy/CpxP family protein refolding chaperone